MTERLGSHLGLLAFLLLCSAGMFLAGWNMGNWGNALSPVGSFFEANALREVDGFRAQGLAHDAGLGNVLFGHRYPGKGFPNTFEFKQNVTTDSGVYTHYPPGPEYLLLSRSPRYKPGPTLDPTVAGTSRRSGLETDHHQCTQQGLG
jgi:hypothetical protein